jgi:hypothetical protein
MTDQGLVLLAAWAGWFALLVLLLSRIWRRRSRHDGK